MSEHAYKHLLLAVDFSPDFEPVIERAVHLRTVYEARLSLLHVLEFAPRAVELTPMSYVGEVPLTEDFTLEAQLLDTARDELERLGERLLVPPEDRHIQVGSAAHAISAAVEALGADLVILGGHGRHGLRALFASTAKTLLQGLTCDVLCVRIRREIDCAGVDPPRLRTLVQPVVRVARLRGCSQGQRRVVLQ